MATCCIVTSVVPVTLILIVALAASAQASAQPRGEQLPLWEAGAGAAVLYMPDYRGADQSRGYVLPIPYFVYRGEFIKADREGVRALFLDTERVELEISVGATVPVNSEDNRARAGMPDLRPTVEVGPVLKVHLAHLGDGAPGRRDVEFDFRLPVRQALTWRDGLRSVGTLAFPQLNVDRKVTWAGARWNLGFVLGGYFADRRYHEYFYGVPAAYASAQRPAYAARGGFGGWQAIAAASTTYGSTWIGAFVKVDWLRGAVFEDSPLVRRRSNVAAGVGVSRIFARSSRLVEVAP
ncbi:MAG: MipA/OmpV family protein [Burkholderiaceae bacterium]|nr:MipA/OmpV family protein [Burkholderiaceae bacterium]